MAVFCLSFVVRLYVVFCFLVLVVQYQLNQFPGKTHLRSDLLCVESDVKHYTLAHPLLRQSNDWLGRLSPK